jgi:environmental stress-induced protein Ves
MPWKNGLGRTEQIEIFPEKSIFPGEDFLWRISSAKVQGASPFSQFPGCDRWLMVLGGQGLLLDGAPLFPEEPIHFS